MPRHVTHRQNILSKERKNKADLPRRPNAQLWLHTSMMNPISGKRDEIFFMSVGQRRTAQLSK